MSYGGKNSALLYTAPKNMAENVAPVRRAVKVNPVTGKMTVVEDSQTETTADGKQIIM